MYRASLSGTAHSQDRGLNAIDGAGQAGRGQSMRGLPRTKNHGQLDFMIQVKGQQV